MQFSSLTPVFRGRLNRAAAEPAAAVDVSEGDDPRRARFARFAAFVLLYNVPVIVFGAFVRVSKSGDGCGSHWPLCNGTALPFDQGARTLIEFTHRLMSGIDGFLVLALFVAALRLFPSGHRVRFAAIFSLFFTIVEALIGAMLVKKGWVADDASPARAVVLAAHLANTFLLLGALTVTAWWPGQGRALRLRGQGAVGGGLLLALAATLFLGISGAVTALGDTLFPVRDSLQAVQHSLSPGAHFLVRLRILHPLIAASVGLYLLLMAGLVSHLRPAPEVRRFARGIAIIFGIEIGVGLLNVLLKAPTAMQLIHLLVADILWINLVLLTAAALAEKVPQVELAGETHQRALTPVLAGAATWRDYLALTKPKVISLLLFTTLATMFIAAGGWPGAGLFFAVALGGYMSAGAANAINMVIDRDIDGTMTRTAKRPTVTQRIPSSRALAFAFTLALGAFALLWAAANLLSAMLALAGLVFYVIVYTLLLKRRTWHNIVIGGAAGAFPPLVGWAAVTGQLSPLAWYLFAIIFVWTPAHFWALALLMKEDYARAGVPMLPVVLGERVTVLQIALYSLLTAVVSILPLAQGLVGYGYVGAAVLLNSVLLLRSFQLIGRPDRPHAVSMYKYSMLYLALLFLAMAVDRAGAQTLPIP